MIEAAGRGVGRAICTCHREDEAEKQPSEPADAEPTPPTPEVACASELMPPDRMQMIENEMAKLENRLRLRCSSWA